MSRPWGGRENKALTTGASGTIGQELVKQLQARGADFAVMSSKPDTVVAGLSAVQSDFADAASLRQAYAGVQTLFLLFPFTPESVDLAHNAVEAAKASGVKHIVRSSGAGAQAGSPVAIADLQGRIDALIEQSGIAYTLLRPAGFMQNWVNFYAGQIKAGSYAAAHGDAAAQAETALRGWGLPPAQIALYSSLAHVYSQGWAAGLSPDVQTLTGHAPRSFADVVAEHVAVWQ